MTSSGFSRVEACALICNSREQGEHPNCGRVPHCKCCRWGMTLPFLAQTIEFEASVAQASVTLFLYLCGLTLILLSLAK